MAKEKIPRHKLLYRGVRTLDLTSYPSERTVKAQISTDDVGRDNRVVLTRGAEFSDYLQNSPVLWAHDHSKPAIGSCLWIAKEMAASPPRIIAKTRFAPTDDGERLRILYSEGVLRAWSIGWDPLEYGPATEDEIRANPEWETAAKSEGGLEVHRRWTLWEYSAVNVPALPQALTLLEKAVSKGMVERQWVRSFLGVELPAGDQNPERESRPEGGGWDETEDSFRYRIHDPDGYDKFRMVEIVKEPPRVKGVYGRKKGTDQWDWQALIFPKPTDEEAGWTLAGAKQWLADHPDFKKGRVAGPSEKDVDGQPPSNPKAIEESAEMKAPPRRVAVCPGALTNADISRIVKETVQDEAAKFWSRQTGRPLD
jgi:hypothetical protein